MVERQMQQRQTAYKIWIGDLIISKFEKLGGDMPLNYVDFKGKKVSRVNVIASVIAKMENDEHTYLEIALDDGTGNVKLKTWREDSEILREISVGDLVLVIGKPREFGNEIYVVPEIVKVLNDLNWLEVRKLELKKENGEYVKEEIRAREEPIVEEQSVVEEEVVPVEPSESARARIINIIEINSSEEGAEMEIVISKSGLSEGECNEIINELLKEGEVYSPKPGKVKLID